MFSKDLFMKRLLLVLALLGPGCLSTQFVATLPAKANQSSTVLPLATSSPQPTATIQPTEIIPPTATPLPPVINAENAAQVDQMGVLDGSSLRKVVFSPDGKIFATGSGNETDFGIITWQSQGGELLQSFMGFTGIVWDLAFSPDGGRIASAADDKNGQRIRIWNSFDGNQYTSLDGPPTASSVAFSPDGALLAVGGLNGWPNGVIRIYDAKSWQLVNQLPAPGQNVTALVFSQDGSQLISSGTDGLIRLWSLSNGAQTKVMSSGRQANRLALSPDGKLLASSFCSRTDSSGCILGGIAVWRTVDWTIVQKFTDLAESVVFSADSNLLVSGSGPNDRLIRIRRVADWTVVKTLQGEAFSVALSPDSRLLVSTRWDKIYLWGLTNK
jgi:WD40 repeat protein